MPKPQSITLNLTIREVIEKYPKTSSVFAKLGIYCFGCPAASFETLNQMARSYNLDPKKLLKDLNSAK